ncbi:MAG: PASTA domain-containing protein [Candidatus Saganbacteria bacterium]|nr:PASTA domain-containing protein [Candidatus Saganbacteria bacterium]
MVQWFIFYLLFLVVFLIAAAIIVIRIKISHPFRIVFLLTAAIAIPVLVQLIFYSFTPELPTVTVPNLVGMSPAEAEKILTLKHLSLKIKEVIPPGDTSPDVILDQLPEAGNDVKTGKVVSVSVSSGPKRVMVPNLIGRPLSQIYVVLQEMGFVLGEIRIKPGTDYPDNTVIEQAPEPNSEAAPGSSLDITIMSNPNNEENE